MRHSRRQLAPDNEDRWMISYADFVTLLFAFFVVMYAASNANTEKYQLLSDSLHQVFDAIPRSLEPIEIGEPTIAASTDLVDLPNSSANGDPNEGDTWVEPSAEVLAERFAGIDAPEQLQVKANNDWLEISLSSQLAFAKGSARLTNQAQAVLTTTAEYLAGFQRPVTIEGYTDNIPTLSNRFGSNWALAGARAAAVAQFFENSGINRKRLSAVGYADNHGVASNATPTGRENNRRVVIVIARRGNLARDLNAQPGSSAFAFVRHDKPTQLDERIEQRRAADGSLIFSNR